MKNEWLDSDTAARACVKYQSRLRDDDARDAMRSALPELVLRSELTAERMLREKENREHEASLTLRQNALADVATQRDRLAARVAELEAEAIERLGAQIGDIRLGAKQPPAPSEQERREHWSRAYAGAYAGDADQPLNDADDALRMYDKRFGAQQPDLRAQLTELARATLDLAEWQQGAKLSHYAAIERARNLARAWLAKEGGS